MQHYGEQLRKQSFITSQLRGRRGLERAKGYDFQKGQFGGGGGAGVNFENAKNERGLKL